MTGWVGVDLDGTLAREIPGPYTGVIGFPVPKMVELVRKWLAQGYEVRIFTARMAYPDVAHIEDQRIQNWLELAGLPPLKTTAVKDKHMIALYDNRAYQVRTNSGIIVGGLDHTAEINRL